MNICNGQAGQDKFVCKVLNYKKNGYFVEIGSNNYIYNNNTFLLEKYLNWNGIMIEYDKQFENEYLQHRKGSIHVLDDATKINYKELFEKYKSPKNIDYLQIDLDVENASTIKTLEKMNNEVFDNYKFACVTFETDIYKGEYFDTKNRSKEIFKSRGYKLVFENVKVTVNGPGTPVAYGEFEDWYVHPDLVNMEYINKISKNQKSNIGLEIEY